MKIRIVEHTFVNRDTYYTVERKVLGLFWVNFLYQYYNIPSRFDNYDSALKGVKEKVSNSSNGVKKYFYISREELVP